MKATVVQAQGAVAQAEARMRQLAELTLPSAREALTQAQANLLNAQQTFDRTSTLAKNGFATRAALDDAQKTLDVARTQVRTAEFQVYTASPGGSDYVMAQTLLNQAHANLETAESRLGYATITAPRDGVLITRNVERGAVVQPGKALLVLAPAGEVQLVLQIDERNLGKISLGQKAVASADAYPDQRFAAVVSYINPGIDITRASVEVKLTVADPPDYLRQDMTVSVDIANAAKNSALVLPVRSVHDVLSGQPWVLGIKDGRAVKRPVKPGLRGNSHIEILEGMTEGEVAIPLQFRSPDWPARTSRLAMNPWLPFEWITAVRFLREGRLQTLFIIGGIAIGVGVIVFMSAMLAGLEANFIKRVLTSQPHIQLLAPDQIARPLRGGAGEIEDARVQRPSQRVISIDQWPKIRAQMLAMPEVTAVSPTMSGSALAVRGDASRAITLSGVEPDSYFKIVKVPDYVVAGEPRLTSEDIIIGIELAKDLGATVGDKLNIQAATGANRVLTISGLVDLGNKGVNQRSTYVALRTAQSLLGMIGGVTTIDMTVTNIYAAEEIAQRIQASDAVEADSWIKTNAQFFTAVQAQETSNTLIRLFVALVGRVRYCGGPDRLGNPALEGYRHPPRHGHLARPDLAGVPAAGRVARFRRLAVRRGARRLRAHLLAFDSAAGGWI